METTVTVLVVKTHRATGDSNMMYQLTASPIDGLKAGADYICRKRNWCSSSPYEAGGWYANYAIGNFQLDMVKDTQLQEEATKQALVSQLQTHKVHRVVLTDAVSIYSKKKVLENHTVQQ